MLAALSGNLVGAVRADPGSPDEEDLARQVAAVLEHVAGRIVFNGWPTGVAVVAAQHHGGPWPAAAAPGFTSVGTAAIRRWLVPVAYQDFPPELRPAALRSARPPHRGPVAQRESPRAGDSSGGAVCHVDIESQNARRICALS